MTSQYQMNQQRQMPMQGGSAHGRASIRPSQPSVIDMRSNNARYQAAEHQRQRQNQNSRHAGFQFPMAQHYQMGPGQPQYFVGNPQQQPGQEYYLNQGGAPGGAGGGHPTLVDRLQLNTLWNLIHNIQHQQWVQRIPFSQQLGLGPYHQEHGSNGSDSNMFLSQHLQEEGASQGYQQTQEAQMGRRSLPDEYLATQSARFQISPQEVSGPTRNSLDDIELRPYGAQSYSNDPYLSRRGYKMSTRLLKDPKAFQAEHKEQVKGLLNIDQNSAWLIRAGAAIFVVLYLVYDIMPVEKVPMLLEEECMRDKTFIWTKSINSFFEEHEDIKRRSIIIASFCLDFMQIVGMIMFNIKMFSYRILLMFGIFFVGRQAIQSQFLMARPEGFLWTHPGIPSLTVPYHDTNDFYYSGHVGTCLMYLMEFYCLKNKFLVWFCTIVLIGEWTLLTLLRTHYIIDLVTGVIVAHYAFITAEWMSYIFDVKLMGFDKKKRNHYAHTPCKKCGWDNYLVDGLINFEERRFLKNLHKMRVAEDEKKNKVEGQRTSIGGGSQGATSGGEKRSPQEGENPFKAI